MQPFHYHVFICDQKKPEGVPCCPGCGSGATLEALRKELELYNPELAGRPWCIVANKMDIPEAQENLKVFKKKYRGITILQICAELGEGIPALKDFLQTKVEEEEKRTAVEKESGVLGNTPGGNQTFDY